jgi:hypothetical protein
LYPSWRSIRTRSGAPLATGKVRSFNSYASIVCG